MKTVEKLKMFDRFTSDIKREIYKRKHKKQPGSYKRDYSDLLFDYKEANIDDMWSPEPYDKKNSSTRVSI